MTTTKTNDASIQTSARGARVFHNIHTEFGESYAFLTPMEARLIARDLINASEEAEMAALSSSGEGKP